VTQIEVVVAALQYHDRGELHGIALHNAATMLSLAATFPGGMHDDVLFQAGAGTPPGPLSRERLIVHARASLTQPRGSA